MVETLRFAGRDKLTAPNTALARARRTGRLVLLQIGSIHQCSAMRTLQPHAVQKARRKDVPASVEWFCAAEWTRLEVSDTRGAENSTA